MALLQPGDLFPNGTASIEFTSGSGTTITPFSQSGNAYVFFETDLINNPNEPIKSLSGATFTSLTASRGAIIDGTGYRAGIITSPGSSFTFTPSVDIPAGRVLLKATGNIGLDVDVASFTGLLNLYPGSAAAYSLRWLNTSYTGSAVEVSRDVDTQVQSIGFTANGSLDSTALLEFATNSSQSLLDYATGSAAAYSLRKVTSDSPVTTLPANFGSGAAAAYSLRKVNANYTGSAIEVRRSSNDDTQDIGFDSNGDLDTTALLAFVGGENRFEDSDPSSGDFATLLNGSTSANDWGLSSPSFTNKTILDRDLGTALAYPRFDEVETGETYTISAYVKIVDGNSATFGSSVGQQGYFSLRGTAAGSPSDYTVTNVQGNIYRISATIVAGSSSGSGFLRWTNANAGKIEITGFQIVKGSTLTDYVETSGDISGFGYVRTWYDQSGNNKDASNGTDTEQPLIVEGGDVVTDNGKPIIKTHPTANFDISATLNTSNATTQFFVGKSEISGVITNTFYAGGNRYVLASKQGDSNNTFIITPDASYLNGSSFTFTDRDNTYSNTTEQSLISLYWANPGYESLIKIGWTSTAWAMWSTQELIIFNNDQTANLKDIEWEINNYYNIYPQWDRQSAIEVRRSSDDTTQDIGFDANGDLDTTALLAFVDEDVNQYTSDFSSPETEDLSEANGTGAATQSIAGVVDAYKFTLSGGSAFHQATKVTNANGGDFSEEVGTLTFDYYLPSGQTTDNINAGFSSGTVMVGSVTDAWQSVSLSITSFGNGTLFFRPRNGTTTTYNGDDDVFYIKNIVVTQTTADGHVRTWYDQSGNHISASNGTDTEQPLIVEAGTVVTQSNRPAIKFDGADYEFIVSNVSARSFYAVLSSVNGGDFVSTTQNRVIFQTSQFDWQEKNFSTSISYTLGNQALLSFNDTTSGIFSLNGVTHTNTDANPYNQGSEVFNRIGANDAGSNLMEGTIQELILFNSDQSTNRLGIESNINAYYDIYTNPSASAYVRTWYDQSGNTNDAIQTAESSRPKIVNTGSLVLENGKLAIDFDGVDDHLEQSLANDFYGTKDIYLFAVTKNASSGETGGITQKRDAVFTGNFGVGVTSGKYQIQTRDTGTGDAILNSVSTYDTQQLLSVSRNSSGLSMYSPETLSISSTVADLTSAGTSEIGTGNSYGPLEGNIQELITYTSSQILNRPEIELNINEEYNIFATSSAAISSPPTISGDVQLGSTLTATPSSISGVPYPVNTFRWEISSTGTDGWSAITGETSLTYAIQDSDLGKYLRIVQIATNGVGSPAESPSTSTDVVRTVSGAFVARVVADGGEVENESAGTTQVEYLSNNP